MVSFARLVYLVVREFASWQFDSCHHEEWQECHRLGGLWAQGREGTSGAVTSDVSGERLEPGSWGCKDNDVGGDEGRSRRHAVGQRSSGRSSCDRPTANTEATGRRGCEPDRGNKDDKCLYVETLWEDDVISNRQDLDEFKAVQQTVAQTLSVRSFPCQGSCRFKCFGVMQAEFL
jgi:hypothetical protein